MSGPAKHPLHEGQKLTDDRQSHDYVFDRELDDLLPQLRWREWMGRIEAVLFASSSPVPRDTLQKVIGVSVSLDLLIEDIRAELKPRLYDLVQVANGWMFRTMAHFSDAIKASANLGDQKLGFNETEMAVLCAVAYHQPITRDGLKEIFGKEINRDTLSRLRYVKMITNGPKAPRPGAPHTFVTTEEFLATFDLQSLRDLSDLEGFNDISSGSPENRNAEKTIV